MSSPPSPPSLPTHPLRRQWEEEEDTTLRITYLKTLIPLFPQITPQLLKDLPKLSQHLQFIPDILYHMEQGKEESFASLPKEQWAQLWTCLRTWATHLLGLWGKEGEEGTKEEVEAMVNVALLAMTNLVAVVGQGWFMDCLDQKDVVNFVSELKCGMERVGQEKAVEALDESLVPFLSNVLRGPTELMTAVIAKEILPLDQIVSHAIAIPAATERFKMLVGVVANMSRSKEVRTALTSKYCSTVGEKKWLYLDPFVHSMLEEDNYDSDRGVTLLLRNLSVDYDLHPFFLDHHQQRYLSYGMFPILWTKGTYNEEEMGKMPIGILDRVSSGKAEPHPWKPVRLNSLEFLHLLCFTRASREKMRACGVYPILREYHKWERDQELLNKVEDIVQLLIQTEEELGIDDLGSLPPPQ